MKLIIIRDIPFLLLLMIGGCTNKSGEDKELSNNQNPSEEKNEIKSDYAAGIDADPTSLSFEYTKTPLPIDESDGIEVDDKQIDIFDDSVDEGEDADEDEDEEEQESITATPISIVTSTTSPDSTPAPSFTYSPDSTPDEEPEPDPTFTPTPTSTPTPTPTFTPDPVIGPIFGRLVHRVFVSSKRYVGDLREDFDNTMFSTGLEGADYRCNWHAQSQSLGGAWKVILSDESEDASEHINIVGPVMNMDDEEVAEDKEEFWSGEIINAINYDERAKHVKKHVHVWSGSLENGKVARGRNCDSWSTNAKSETAKFGQLNKSNKQWLHKNGKSTKCEHKQRLYCIEVFSNQ